MSAGLFAAAPAGPPGAGSSRADVSGVPQMMCTTGGRDRAWRQGLWPVGCSEAWCLQDDPLRFAHVEASEQGFLFGVEGGALVEDEIFGLETPDVEATEDGADLAPGLVGAGLGDADDQQREEAEQDVASDPVFEAVVDGAQQQLALGVAQRLLPRADGAGRCLASEVLPGTTKVRQAIEDGAPASEIAAHIDSQADVGGVSLNESLAELVVRGTATLESALGAARDAAGLERLVAARMTPGE